MVFRRSGVLRPRQTRREGTGDAFSALGSGNGVQWVSAVHYSRFLLRDAMLAQVGVLRGTPLRGVPVRKPFLIVPCGPRRCPALTATRVGLGGPSATCRSFEKAADRGRAIQAGAWKAGNRTEENWQTMLRQKRLPAPRRRCRSVRGWNGPRGSRTARFPGRLRHYAPLRRGSG